MTLKEISKQIYELSNGLINGKQITRSGLERLLREKMSGNSRYVGEAALPDGNWLFSVDRFGRKQDEYDYYIPDTREKEMLLR